MNNDFYQTLSIIWEAFASAVRYRNLKPSPYILDTLMHNVFLANGAAPGFRPADTSELVLPSKVIENAYENVYQLKDYAAIVMYPCRLGAMQDFSPIYYSLAYPTMLEGSPAIKNAASIISELRDINTLMQTLERVLEKQAHLSHEIIKNLVFEYFHTEDDQFREIGDSKEITLGDQNLANCTARFKDKVFPYQGPFFRGCIRISKNNGKSK